MKLRYKFMLVIVTLLLLSCITIGSSYSLWLSNSTQLGENTMNIGCFNLTFEDSDAITLTNSYPIPHSVGRNLHPYTFTITNVCDYTASFNVNLELLSSTTLSESDIRVMLNNGGSKLYSEYEAAEGILSSDGTTLSDASTNKSRKIASGVLWPNKSRTYSLRLWIDEDATSSAMNKALNAKVVTSSTPYVDKNPCTYEGELVQGAEYTDGTYTYRYMQEGSSSGWQNITEDGWGVKLSTPSMTGVVDTKICTSINEKPIVSMSYMFAYFGILSKIDVSSFDTSNVVRMNDMFYETSKNNSMESFEIVGLSSFDTSNVTNMARMFYYTGTDAGSYKLDSLSSWDTSKVTNMQEMFIYAGRSSSSWSIGDLSNWDTSNVESMEQMFRSVGQNSTNVSVGDLSRWNTSKVTNMSYMFAYFGYKNESVDVGNLSSWDISNVTDTSRMFDHMGYNAKSFNIGDLSSWDTGKVTNMSYMLAYLGYQATSFNIGNLSKWNTSNVTDMSHMFLHTAGSYNIETFDIGNLSSWDTGKVTTMYEMFSDTGSYATTWNIGDISSWNVSNVLNMSYMFSGTGGYYASINIGDLSNWDTRKVTNMSLMFQNSKIFSNEGNGIGTLNVYATNIYGMFSGCSKAKATINIYSNPEIGSSGFTGYNNAFYDAATSTGSLITVNYSSATTNIDVIIATKSSNSNVVKGVQLD